MIVLLDANIVLRTIDTSAPLRPVARSAVDALRIRGCIPCIVPQTLYEFWVVATRPLDKNGLGLSAPDCIQEVATLKRYYPLLLDSELLYSTWELLVSERLCHGKVAHDARYVAAMRTHQITQLLTFNRVDFTRYPDITILDPHTIASATSGIIA